MGLCLIQDNEARMCAHVIAYHRNGCSADHVLLKFMACTTGTNVHCMLAQHMPKILVAIALYAPDVERAQRYIEKEGAVHANTQSWQVGQEGNVE